MQTDRNARLRAGMAAQGVDALVLPATGDVTYATGYEAGAVLLQTATVTDPAVGTVTGQDVVVVTASGPELLTNSPWWDE
jgi:Xaa-Pro aminopeptidase